MNCLHIWRYKHLGRVGGMVKYCAAHRCNEWHYVNFVNG